MSIVVCMVIGDEHVGVRWLHGVASVCRSMCPVCAALDVIAVTGQLPPSLFTSTAGRKRSSKS